jgi:hypothetical protein
MSGAAQRVRYLTAAGTAAARFGEILKRGRAVTRQDCGLVRHVRGYVDAGCPWSRRMSPRSAGGSVATPIFNG